MVDLDKYLSTYATSTLPRRRHPIPPHPMHIQGQLGLISERRPHYININHEILSHSIHPRLFQSVLSCLASNFRLPTSDFHCAWLVCTVFGISGV